MEVCNMRILFTILLSLSVMIADAQESQGEYEDFLADQHLSAKEYILSLFEKYDIVILCERDHREITQYDLILDVISDKRFRSEVGNIYTEIGNFQRNDILNEFLCNDALSDRAARREALEIQRDSYGAGLWEKSNYAYFIHGVWDTNKRDDNNVKIYNLDIGIRDWATATVEDIRNRDSLMPHRDSILADNFLQAYNSSGSEKALVIMNFRHAFVKDVGRSENAGRYIAEHFPEKVANVMISGTSLSPEMSLSAIAQGRWDSSFMNAGKENVGFDFAGSPFGQTDFDMIPLPGCGNYEDWFTGIVYYTYFPDYRIVCNFKNFISRRFAKELIRRYQLEAEVYDNPIPTAKELKARYNTVVDIKYSEDPMFDESMTEIEKYLH